MEQEKISVSYELKLTGSKFFDTIILMRARELAMYYPGLELEVEEGKCLRLHGELTHEIAQRLHGELEMSEINGQ